MKIFDLTYILIVFSISFSWSTLSCPDFLKKYPDECELSDRYLSLKKNVYDEYNINMDYLTGYRARRLIDKEVWEKEQDRIRCRPERAYLPDPDVWINWEKGAMAVSNILLDEKLAPANERNLNLISRERIEDINTQSVNIDIMGWMATTLKGASPGRIRQSSHEVPGFTFNCVGAAVKKHHMENVNDFDLLDDNGDPLVTAIYHACPNGDTVQGVLSYTATSNVEPELKKLISFVNENINKFRLGTNKPDYSPLDFIADTQRWFVAIHPFGDGNGRTSRFLQDYLLAKFGLPYAPSGNLQYDVLLNKEEYRELFKEEMKKTVEELNSCRSEFREVGLDKLDDLSCECRPMYVDELPLPIAPFAFDPMRKKGDDVVVNIPCDNGIGKMLGSDFNEYLFNIIWSLQDGQN